MQKDITLDRKITALRMSRKTFDGIFVLLEGNTDRRFYRRYLSFPTHYEIQVIGSKQSIIKILETLNKDNFPDIFAIVDADFDHLDPSNAAQLPNLFRTDTHDLETLILSSPALDKILNEFASEEKLDQQEVSFREILLRLGQPLGYLLWISLQEELGLKFEELKFGRFIDKDTLGFDLEKMIETVRNQSSNEAKARTLDFDALKRKIQAYQQEGHDPWQVCCGHHLVEILALALRRVIGTNDPSDVNPKIVLDRALRLAYESAYFQETKLYTALQTWYQQSSLRPS